MALAENYQIYLLWVDRSVDDQKHAQLTKMTVGNTFLFFGHLRGDVRGDKCSVSGGYQVYRTQKTALGCLIMSRSVFAMRPVGLA